MLNVLNFGELEDAFNVRGAELDVAQFIAVQRAHARLTRYPAVTSTEVGDLRRFCHTDGGWILWEDMTHKTAIPSLRSTRRGVSADYDGSDPRLCNARTKSGRPCRALKLVHGRCKWLGGLSTGAKTSEGKAHARVNLKQYQAKVEKARSRLIREAELFAARVNTAK